MQFLALSALTLALIGRCVAEPIPIAAMRLDTDLARGLPPLPPLRAFNNLPAHDLNAFWPCLRCSVECAAVITGCTMVCVVGAADPALCGVSDPPFGPLSVTCYPVVDTNYSLALYRGRWRLKSLHRVLAALPRLAGSSYLRPLIPAPLASCVNSGYGGIGRNLGCQSR